MLMNLTAELIEQGSERWVADQPLLPQQVEAQQLQHWHIKVNLIIGFYDTTSEMIFHKNLKRKN